MQEFELDQYQEADEHIWHSHEWTAQEALFVQELLFHGDPTRAYAKAFKIDKEESNAGWRATCAINGGILSEKRHIAAYVRYVREKIRARMEVTPERVLHELACMAYANMADFQVIQEDGTAVTDLSGLTREQFASVQEMTVDVYMEGKGEGAKEVKSVKLKLAPKIAALELLGKHMKLFTEVIENNNVTDAETELSAARKRSQKLRDKSTSDEDTGENEDG